MMYWSVVLLVGALFVSESEAATLTQIFFVYPGTKWCGNGATAKSYTDLGKCIYIYIYIYIYICIYIYIYLSTS